MSIDRDATDPFEAEPELEETEAPRSSRSRGSSEDGEPQRDAQKHMPLALEMVLLLVLALFLAVVIKSLFLQAFYIPSGSMHDTLIENDRILVEKPSYWRNGPSRGDIVVFKDPGGWLAADDGRPPSKGVTRFLEVFGLSPTGGHLVKRVIGVGGDHVVCCDKDGNITVNGVALHEESYLAPGEKPSLITFDKTVPPNFLWVQGDNRSHSADSRVHLGDAGGGFVPEDDVVGKVFSVVWPFDHAKLIHRPETFEGVKD